MSSAPGERHPRVPYDWYVEPRWTVEALFETIPMSGTVGDPACGIGTIPEIALARGHDIVATDVVDRGYARMSAVADFLDDASALHGVHNIVCNPPYGYRPGIAEAFARQALSIGAATVAFLMPVRWLTSEVRFRLFAEHTPARILFFSERPSMPPGHMIEELGARAFRGGTIDYCWVVWERLPSGEMHGAAEVSTVSWIRPRPREQRR